MALPKPPALLKFIARVSLVAALAAPAFGQDRMDLGPRQFQWEPPTGAGAVLCIWLIHVTVQAWTAECGLPRSAADSALDESIAAMDEFIIANSSLHPTRAALADFKRRAAESELSGMRREGSPKMCVNRDIEGFRQRSPDQISASTKELLAVPREPVMNPCL